MRRLAVLAAEAGAEIREHDRVQSPDQLDAEQVLVATDGYLSGLLGQLEGLIVPTRGQMIATEPIGERLFDCPHYGRHGFDYWQQTPDGRIVAGGYSGHGNVLGLLCGDLAAQAMLGREAPELAWMNPERLT